MAPKRSCAANARLTTFIDWLAHIPSVVPRTVMATDPPPRFWFAIVFHIVGSRTSSQPPEAWGGCSVSIVSIAHLVMTRTSVLPFSKSTSNSLKGASNGVHCTEMTFMFGGTRTLSFGYTTWMAGVPPAQAGAPLGGKVHPGQSGAVKPASRNGSVIGPSPAPPSPQPRQLWPSPNDPSGPGPPGP